MSQPRTKLYWALAACSPCPHILLLETSVSFISIANSITKEVVTPTQNSSSINPEMRVPVLPLEDEIITGTGVPAIVTAISSLAPKLRVLRLGEWMKWAGYSMLM